jgi:hypothetical protein
MNHLLSVKILLLLTLVGFPFPALSEAKQLRNDEAQILQIEISDRDLKIIEKLTAIAQRHSSQVQEAKNAMGLNAFTDILNVELSPSRTTINYTLPHALTESENSFSITMTIDPIKLLGSIQELPLRRTRWQEAKQQKRVLVVQHYLAYLQARQAKKIATYRMQQFALVAPKNKRVASLNSQVNSPAKVNYLANSDYVTIATDMLNANAREHLTLEELAACVGLSSQATITLLESHN